MTHEERVQIAYEIARKILDRYGEAIVAVAVYGSVAKNQDTEHSDIEMWVATGDDLPKDEQLFIHRGISIEISYMPAQGLLKAARRVDSEWPIQADALRSYLVLYERDDFIAQLKQAAQDLPKEDFEQAIRSRMVRTHETISKLKNARDRDDLYGIMENGRILAWSTAMIIGLANRGYYPGGRGLYQLSKQAKLQPKDYGSLLDTAGGFTSTDKKQVYEAALDLWDNLQEFVGGLGIGWADEVAF